jgi:hypothetical protein
MNIECCRFCSSVGEIFRYTSVHIISEKRMMCVDLATSGESCEVFSLGLVLCNSEVVSKLSC